LVEKIGSGAWWRAGNLNKRFRNAKFKLGVDKKPGAGTLGVDGLNPCFLKEVIVLFLATQVT
jgi:hypothetical protein